MTANTMERTIEEVTGGKKVVEWLREQMGTSKTAAVWRLVRAGLMANLPPLHRGAEAYAWYVAMRLDGTPHKMAEMFALQQPPGSKSDREFLEGHCNGSQFDGQEYIGDFYAAEAKKAGVSIKGKVYVNGLAQYPGDPRAWVSDRSDVLRVARENGMTVSGAVDYKPDSRLADLAMAKPDTRVADDLVHSAMMDRMEADPSLALRDQGEVFAETRERIAPHWE